MRVCVLESYWEEKAEHGINTPSDQGVTFVPKLARSGLPLLSEPVVVQITRPCQSAADRPGISTLTVKVNAPPAPRRWTKGIASK